MVEVGFRKGDSANLPRLSTSVMFNYITRRGNEWIQAETRGVKTNRSGRDAYGDDAIGYVQVKREGENVTVKGRVCPEHKVRSTPYHVQIDLTEHPVTCETLDVISLKCMDCIACNGGCKHSFAFLTWLNRRSEEKACTSVTSYWNKPRLSKVGNVIRTAKEMAKKKKRKPKKALKCDTDFFTEFLKKASLISPPCQIMHHFTAIPITRALSMHILANNFLETGGTTAIEFFNYCKSKLNDDNIIEVAKLTEGQSNCPGWFHIKYGRISASKVHEVAHCKTKAGSTVEKLLGAKHAATDAMKRGIRIESDVLIEVERKLNIKVYSSGFILDPKYPIFGASPDGVSTDFVFEVKSPSKAKTIQNYVKKDNTIAPKVLAQIQMQMLFTKKKSGFLCVASPSFESDKNVYLYQVAFDEQYIVDLMRQAEEFWTENVFHLLIGK